MTILFYFGKNDCWRAREMYIIKKLCTQNKQLLIFY